MNAVSEIIDSDILNMFRKKIISWYENHGRKNLPWRKEKDPWRVMIASILLKKTTAVQVKKIYKKFIEKFPHPHSLANADEEELKALLAPLGMEHTRTKLLLKLAKTLVQEYNGGIPSSIEKLMKLPGVGRYSASEVLLLSYNDPHPLLDRNMIRLLERIFNIRSEKSRPHTDPYMWKIAEKIVPSDPALAKKFNFGVLDFAQSVCKAKNPRCEKCPFKNICTYYKNVKISGNEN